MLIMGDAYIDQYPRRNNLQVWKLEHLHTIQTLKLLRLDYVSVAYEFKVQPYKLIKSVDN